MKEDKMPQEETIKLVQSVTLQEVVAKELQEQGEMTKPQLIDAIKARLPGFSPMIQEKILRNIPKSNKKQLERILDMID